MIRWAVVITAVLLGALGLSWITFSSYFTAPARFISGGLSWVDLYILYTQCSEPFDQAAQYYREKRRNK